MLYFLKYFTVVCLSQGVLSLSMVLKQSCV